MSELEKAILIYEDKIQSYKEALKWAKNSAKRMYEERMAREKLVLEALREKLEREKAKYE